MEVVIDANVLFRTLISSGEIVKILFNPELKIFAPEVLGNEFLSNKNEILSKSKLSEIEFDALASLLLEKIIFVPLDEYKEFLPKARSLLGRHAKDEDFIAVCLMKKAKLWTYEKLLFELSFGISTKEISEKLSKPK